MTLVALGCKMHTSDSQKEKPQDFVRSSKSRLFFQQEYLERIDYEGNVQICAGNSLMRDPT